MEKIFKGWVKKISSYPDGRTSLLLVVTEIAEKAINQRHVNLNILTEDVIREGICYRDTVAFLAEDFNPWVIGVSRFLGQRQVNEKGSAGYNLPKLTNTPGSIWGKLGDWADTKALTNSKTNPNLYLTEDITPIFGVKGFDTTSVCLDSKANERKLPPIREMVKARLSK